MLQKFIKFLGVAVQSTITSLLWADVVPAPLFSNGMVLQQEYKIPVWGTADPDEKVQLTFAGETLQTKADKQGFWILTLKPQKANSVPQEMLLKGKKNEVKIQDVLIGEVVLAGGQSNMEVPIKESENPLESAAEANDPPANAASKPGSPKAIPPASSPTDKPPKPQANKLSKR